MSLKVGSPRDPQLIQGARIMGKLGYVAIVFEVRGNLRRDG